jgi:protein TonB
VQAFAGPANAPVEAAAGSAPVAAVAAAADSAPAAVTAPPPPSFAATPDLLAAYRQQLTRLLAGQREYPRIAALRGWEGEVRLRLRVARKGNLLGVALDRSSGFEVLDQHALAMLAAMAGLPPLPEGLDGGEIQVVVPIQYKLNKTT